MAAKPRQIPSEISTWMEKDVTLQKITVGSRLLHTECKQNFFISREFYSHMLSLSSERYRKMIQCDFNKKTFLKNQRFKAETSLPGLRPYVDQLIDEMNRDTSFSPSLKKSDSFQSPSVQTFASRSINRSETSSQRRSKTPQPMASSHSTIITKHPSMERINRLAQPKGHRFHSASHVRSTLPENLTSQDLFGNLDDGRHHRQRPSNAEKPKITSEDHRFHELVRSFSDVHQRALSQSPTVNSIVQANPSLQTDREQRIINRRLLLSRSTNRHRLLPQFYNKTHTQWIDISA